MKIVSARDILFSLDRNFVTLIETDEGFPTRLRAADAYTRSQVGEVDELVGAAIYLDSDAASFTTDQLLFVDGGMLASGVNQ